MLQSMGLQRVKHDRATEQQHGNFMFNFLRNHQSVLQSSCTILYPHKPYTRVSISSHPCQHLPFSVFLLFSIFSCLIFIIYFFPVALGLACSFSSSLSCPSLFSALIHYPMQSRTRYKSPSNAIH